MLGRLVTRPVLAGMFLLELAAAGVAQGLSSGDGGRSDDERKVQSSQQTPVEEMLLKCLDALEKRAHKLGQIERKLSSHCPPRPDVAKPDIAAPDIWRRMIEQAIRARLQSVGSDGTMCGKLDFRLEQDARVVIEAQVTDRAALEEKIRQRMEGFLPLQLDFSGLEAQPVCLEPFADGWMGAKVRDGWKIPYRTLRDKFSELIPRLPEIGDCAALGAMLQRAPAAADGDIGSFWVRDPDKDDDLSFCTYRHGKWEPLTLNRAFEKALILLRPSQKSR